MNRRCQSRHKHLHGVDICATLTTIYEASCKQKYIHRSQSTIGEICGDGYRKGHLIYPLDSRLTAATLNRPIEGSECETMSPISTFLRSITPNNSKVISTNR